MKASIFDGRHSYVAVQSCQNRFITFYNFEDYSFIYLCYIYLAHLFGCHQNTEKWVKVGDLVRHNAVKYVVACRYESGKRIDEILCSASKPCDNSVPDIGFVAILNDIDITDAVRSYYQSLKRIDMTVAEFVQVLCARKFLSWPPIAPPVISFMDMDSLSEQVFKANDIIKI